MKKIIKSLFTLVLLFSLFPSANVFAEENDNSEHPKSCGVVLNDTEKLPILIEDNSKIEIMRGSIITVSVDKTYSVHIQNANGSCSDSARLRVTGKYSYDSSTNNIVDASVSVSKDFVPSLWTVNISSTSNHISGASLTVEVRYNSNIDDPFGCTIGGLPWYNMATFTIR